MLDVRSLDAVLCLSHHFCRNFQFSHSFGITSYSFKVFEFVHPSSEIELLQRQHAAVVDSLEKQHSVQLELQAHQAELQHSLLLEQGKRESAALQEAQLEAKRWREDFFQHTKNQQDYVQLIQSHQMLLQGNQTQCTMLTELLGKEQSAREVETLALKSQVEDLQRKCAAAEEVLAETGVHINLLSARVQSLLGVSVSIPESLFSSS